MNNRRKLVIAFGASALAAPFASFAQQQGKVWRVGFLTIVDRPASLDSYIYGAFSRGMRELGYTEGKNLEFHMKTAKALGLKFPNLIQMQATKVIE